MTQCQRGAQELGGGRIGGGAREETSDAVRGRCGVARKPGVAEGCGGVVDVHASVFGLEGGDPMESARERVLEVALPEG